MYSDKVASGAYGVLEVDSLVVLGILPNREAVILGCIPAPDDGGNYVNRQGPSTPQKSRFFEGDYLIRHRQGQQIRLSNSGSVFFELSETDSMELSETSGFVLKAKRIESHSENHYSLYGVEPLVQANSAASALPGVSPARVKYVFFSRRSDPKSPFVDARFGDLSDTGVGDPSTDISGIVSLNVSDRAFVGADATGRIDIQGNSTRLNPLPDATAAKTPEENVTASSATSRIQFGGDLKPATLRISAGQQSSSIPIETSLASPGTVEIVGDVEVILGDPLQPSSRIQADIVTIIANSSLRISVTGPIQISGTSVSIDANNIILNGAVSLGSPGGAPVARVGDVVQAGPYTGTIISGSSVVRAS